MAINPGDPVTSDLISLIIANLQTVAKGETVSNIAVDASGLANNTDGAKATVAYNTVVPVPSSVKVSSAASATNEKTVQFGKTFTGTPYVWVQMNSTEKFANSQVFPQVVSVGPTSCNLLFRTSTANGTLKFTLFVAGQLA